VEPTHPLLNTILLSNLPDVLELPPRHERLLDINDACGCVLDGDGAVAACNVVLYFEKE